MRIADTITELIGNTPLVRIQSLSKQTGNEIIGKLESFNPLSSVKDRIALNMVEEAEKHGLLKPGGTIIEPTSGNTGIGLAYIAAAKGYKIILTMPESMSQERRNLLKALGAKLVLTPASGGMKAAIAEAEKLGTEHPDSFIPQQFTNPANPEMHRRTTAREILTDTDGNIDHFVAGIGTGGTITGVGKVLREHIPDITITAVEPEESAVLSGSPPGPHKIQGIGAGFIPGILDTSAYDDVMQVSSVEAAEMTRQLAKTEGLLVGISSGAAVVAAYRIAQREKNAHKRIVVLLPDSGERYLSTWIFQES